MQEVHFSRKQRFSAGVIAGLGAGIIASALMLFLSVTVGGISLPEAVGSAFTETIPSSLFEYLHRTIGGDAKHYLFYGILVGQCLVFALSGGIWNLIIGSSRVPGGNDGQGRLRWQAGALLAFLLWLLTGLAFLPLVGAGVFGAALSIGFFNGMLSLGIVGLAFGLLFVLIQNWLVTRRLYAQKPELKESLTEAEASDARRAILRNGLAVLGLGTLGVLAWRFISSGGSSSSSPLAIPQSAQSVPTKIAPPRPAYGTLEPVDHLSPEVTTNDQFYVVSKNLFQDPTVNGTTWQLSVDGLVEKPYTLTYKDLQAMPMQQQYETLECISNEVGGSYMSNAHWEGVQLAELLKRGGNVKTGATKVVLYAADDYSDSIHLSKALEPTTLVALRMNGSTLPTGHGYPARLLVPGIYGMKHVKWITRIQVVSQDYQGYWQMRGWSDPAPVRLTSRIDVPLPNTTISTHKPNYIAGVAFSGDKGIGAVEVSVDNGQSWQRATLKKPLSAISWTLWELPWTPTKSGSQSIAVRAIDLQGNVQSAEVATPLPDGSSGYHTVSVNVS